MNRQLLPFEAALVRLPFGKAEDENPRAEIIQRLRSAWLDSKRHIFQVTPAEGGLKSSRADATALRHWGDELEHLVETVSECCFIGSNLNQRLRILGVRVVVFAGGQMGFNLETAVRSASSFGYAVFVAHDCCAGASNMLQHYATVRSSEEIIAAAAPILSMPRGRDSKPAA